MQRIVDPTTGRSIEVYEDGRRGKPSEAVAQPAENPKESGNTYSLALLQEELTQLRKENAELRTYISNFPEVTWSMEITGSEKDKAAWIHLEAMNAPETIRCSIEVFGGKDWEEGRLMVLHQFVHQVQALSGSKMPSWWYYEKNSSGHRLGMPGGMYYTIETEDLNSHQQEVLDAFFTHLLRNKP